MNMQLSGGVRGLTFGLSLHLLSYFTYTSVYACSKDSDETAHMCSLQCLPMGQTPKSACQFELDLVILAKAPLFSRTIVKMTKDAIAITHD